MPFTLDHHAAYAAQGAPIGLTMTLMPQRNVTNPTNNNENDSNPQVNSQTPLTEIFQLAQAIQNSIAINKIPVPMLTVFSGDPISYIERKTSFISLVDCKAISSADKLHLLKKCHRPSKKLSRRNIL